MDIREYIDKKKKIIDKALDQYLPSVKTKPAVIHKAMRYSMFPGGKRIRPVLTLAGFEACGGKGNGILPVACAIEFIHAYTLIHDDLPCMDNDDYRRGKLSCHKKFNEGLALLAGDALLTMGLQMLSETGKTGIVTEITKAAGSSGIIGGQVVDMETQGGGKDKKELDYIVSHKTGLLFEAAVKVAGMFKGAGEKKINALAGFGRHLGFVFQLIDDLIDKDGYVKLYGEEHTRKMAALLTDRAKGQLNIFGKKAKRLSGIADLFLKRHS
ncbi:MAG: polyprenyl synthetase family protein [Candidatus Omnitrophica bacterium]|nr:polyprenyl synthetase family protein [Candidatus Omnitrophota bacterium]